MVLVTVVKVRVRHFRKHQETCFFLNSCPKTLTDVRTVIMIFFIVLVLCCLHSCLNVYTALLKSIPLYLFNKLSVGFKIQPLMVILKKTNTGKPENH